MINLARGFGEYVVLIAGGVGVALIAALIVLALSRVTLPTLRLLWHRASPLGRLFGALLFLICSINATTKAPSRNAPKRVAVSVATTASESQPTRIEKWFRRGAWRDDHCLKFDTDWVFPHGTNHYSGIWIYSWGKLAAPRTRQSFAALGTELALFPEESEVTWGRTSSNSYRIAWQNGFPDRRSRENAISASFELFRNGDIAITTNNVTRYIERELPFDCAGRGQDTAWVAANYPNDVEAIVETGGYAAWVDEKVGIGLENGLYRFTATFPTPPLEAIELFVGPYTVAVTNADDYVFLLEKGRDYSFGTRPFIADVTYAAVDDLGTANNMLRSASGWRGSTWSTAGGGLEWTLPTETTFGECCWLPYFQGAPDLPYLSTSAFPSVFEGVLSDAAEGLGASEDADIGLRKKGDYKSIGVASEQWQLDLLNCARGFLGKTGYGLDEDCPGQYGFATVPAGSWKCNIFVAYRACQLGFTVPAMHKRYFVFDLPPLANEWAGSQQIEGWAHAQGEPQPGWIIAHPSARGSGHVGITDFDGAGIAAGSKVVSRCFEYWQDGSSVYRKKE